MKEEDSSMSIWIYMSTSCQISVQWESISIIWRLYWDFNPSTNAYHEIPPSRKIPRKCTHYGKHVVPKRRNEWKQGPLGGKVKFARQHLWLQHLLPRNFLWMVPSSTTWHQLFVLVIMALLSWNSWLKSWTKGFIPSFEHCLFHPWISLGTSANERLLPRNLFFRLLTNQNNRIDYAQNVVGMVCSGTRRTRGTVWPEPHGR